MEGIIKEYLESQARIDPCFKEKYKPEDFEGCIEYITAQAEKLVTDKHGKQCVAVKDEEVFKWARDYFNDGINVKEAEERKLEEQKAAEEEKALDETRINIEAEIEESRKKAEEYRKQREEEERSKREHANGQTTIFDILGG